MARSALVRRRSEAEPKRGRDPLRASEVSSTEATLPREPSERSRTASLEFAVRTVLIWRFLLTMLLSFVTISNCRIEASSDAEKTRVWRNWQTRQV